MEIKSDNVMITLDDKIIYVYLNHHGNLTCSPHLPNIIKYNCTFLIEVDNNIVYIEKEEKKKEKKKDNYIIIKFGDDNIFCQSPYIVKKFIKVNNKNSSYNLLLISIILIFNVILFFF